MSGPPAGPWNAVVTRRAHGYGLRVVVDLDLPTREAAVEVGQYLLAQMDAWLPDVAGRLREAAEPPPPEVAALVPEFATAPPEVTFSEPS